MYLGEKEYNNNNNNNNNNKQKFNSANGKQLNSAIQIKLILVY
jgi:hypothetical protein